MSRCDRIALVICFGVLLVSIFVAFSVYDSIPHIEDEMAFVWQSRLLVRGQISIPPPQPNPASFIVPFVVDFQGHRFGKYPVGWPIILAFGEWLHIRSFVNPLITSLAFWFIYRLIKKVVDEKTALLAIALGSVSPYVLVNAGSLLSHPWSLLLTVIFATSWLDAFSVENSALPVRLSRWLPAITAAMALGLLILTRPWTAVAISIPFAFHALFLIFRKPKLDIQIRLGSFCVIAGGISSLYFVWQFAVTGSFFTNPYTLWWPYDQIGFGPGIGLQPGGYQPIFAKANTLFSLFSANTDLYGWPTISWIFLPFGCIALIRNLRAWIISFSLVSLVAAYALYWTHPQVYGPRYYFEALPAALMLTAAGIRWLAGHFTGQNKVLSWNMAGKTRFVITTSIVLALITGNLVYYLPARLRGISELSGISQKCINPLKEFSAARTAPILFFIHVQKNFHEYSCAVDLSSPFGDSKNLIAISRGKEID
ncbi:MAG: hypothetical protein IH586_08045, partial [Anaerolineaceae bacterium]|nr:hypothetical protein [Anaerolineaceae bacterium]